MDVYVHAASYEPFGFVIPEAMANGVPVVSTATGAALDAIRHLENGYLVPQKDFNQLAQGIMYMLSNDTKNISQNAIKTAKEMFDFEIMWNNYINLYKRALENYKTKT